MRTRLHQAPLGAFALAALIGALSGGAGAAAPAGEAKVLSVTGKLEVNGKAAAAGAILHRGDRLATGADSHAFIGFSDGSAVRLNAGSRLDLADLGKKTGLDLQSGSVLSAV